VEGAGDRGRRLGGIRGGGGGEGRHVDAGTAGAGREPIETRHRDFSTNATGGHQSCVELYPGMQGAARFGTWARWMMWNMA